MAKDKISQYAFTPAANTDIGGINIDEGCAPSGINNAIRTLMTQIKDLQAGVSGDTIPLTAGGTGSGTAASARAALGLAIGTNVLGYVTPGASGNILLSDGSNWTSVAQSAAITLDTITGGPLALAKGGTNATTAAQARTNLGLAIGTNVLGYVTAGATGQVLTSTGTGWVSQAAGGGGQLQTELFTAPGTWTKPASCTQVRVTVIGGGGGGASAPTSADGGYGGLAIASNVPVSGPVSVTVGSGGKGAPSATGGGTSSFGPLVSATGGSVGSPAPSNGSGTISGGNAIKTGSIFNPAFNRTTILNVAYGFITGATFREVVTPTSDIPGVPYSTTSTYVAGAGGDGNTTAASVTGGVGGAVLVEFVG